MPLYEDLVVRALKARERAASLNLTARRVSDLARILRQAHAGEILLRRCAWCERLDVGGEWLHLEAIGGGQHRITSDLLRHSTSGICPECFEQQSEEVEAARGRPSSGQ